MGWMDVMKSSWNEKRMCVEQGRMSMRYRTEWRAAVITALTILGGGSRTSGVTLGPYQVLGGRVHEFTMKW